MTRAPHFDITEDVQEMCLDKTDALKLISKPPTAKHTQEEYAFAHLEITAIPKFKLSNNQTIQKFQN